MCSKVESEKHKRVLASGLSCSLSYLGLEGPKAGRIVTFTFGHFQLLIHNLIVTIVLAM